MSMGDELTQLPNRLILDEDIIPYFSAVNSHGDVVVGNRPDNIKIIQKTGKSKVVKSPERGPFEQFGVKVIEQYIRGLAVDKNNNVYVVSCLKISTEMGELKIYVLDELDENYNAKEWSILDDLDSIDTNIGVMMAVTKNNDIVVIGSNNPQVFVYDNTGKLKHKFDRSLCTAVN